jgi:hypothetical protein
MAKDGKLPESTFGIKDPEAFAINLARMIEEAGKAASAYLKPREEGKLSFDFADSVTDAVKTLTKIGEYWMGEPERALEAQNRLFAGYLGLWTASLKRMMGETTPPAAEPDPRDRRFTDSEWTENQFFDFIKQFYLITSRWAEQLVDEAKDLDPQTRRKAAFYVKQLAAALLAVELRHDQSGSPARNLVVGRRQSGARHAHARRGHQGRRRRPQDPSLRSVQVQARREHRHDSGQGHPPERSLPADPV